MDDSFWPKADISSVTADVIDLVALLKDGSAMDASHDAMLATQIEFHVYIDEERSGGWPISVDEANAFLDTLLSERPDLADFDADESEKRKIMIGWLKDTGYIE